MSSELLFGRFEPLKIDPYPVATINSNIHLVYDKEEQRRVILKIYKNSSKQSHRRYEIEILKKLTEQKNVHSGNYIDSDKEDESNPKWLAVEFVEGRTLLENKNQILKLPFEEKIILFRRILEAYKSLYLTAVHKDINPKNIMLSDDFKKISIIDFGASLSHDSGLVERIGEWDAYDQFYSSYHTPEEKLKKDYVIGPHTDVYKLGLLLQQIFTNFGTFPETQNEAKTKYRDVDKADLKKQIQEKLESSYFVEELAEIISKSLKCETEDRYDHAGEMLDAFDKKIYHKISSKYYKKFFYSIKKLITSGPARLLLIGIAGLSLTLFLVDECNNGQEASAPTQISEPTSIPEAVPPAPTQTPEPTSTPEVVPPLPESRGDLIDPEDEKEEEEKKEFEEKFDQLSKPPALNVICDNYSIDQGKEFRYEDCFQYESANEDDTHIVKLFIIDRSEEREVFNAVATDGEVKGGETFYIPGKKYIRVILENQNGISVEETENISVKNVIPKIIDLQDRTEVEKNELVNFVFYYNDPGKEIHKARIKWTKLGPWQDIVAEDGIIKTSHQYQEGGEFEVTIGIKDQYSDWTSESFLAISSICGINEKPGRPGKPYIKKYGIDGIKVSWAKSKCIGDNGSYQVIEKNNLLNKSETEDNSISFNNLKPGTYQFKIKATNGNGSSLDSLENYWKEEVKFFKPENLVIGNDGIGKLILNWDYQNYDNKICFNIYRFGNIINNSPVCNLTYQDSNLLSGNSYSYQVAAYSQIYESEGPKSDVKSSIVQGLPGIPNMHLEYISDGNIKINLVSTNNGGAERVRFDIYRSGDGILIASLAYGQSSYIDINEGDGKEYFYEASAINNWGESEKSNKLFKIHHGKPGKPVLTITPSEDELNLKWLKVSDGGSNLYYEVWDYDSGKKIGSDITSVSNEIAFTINQENYGSPLSSETEYSFFIKAKNMKGFSQDSDNVKVSPKEKDITKLDAPTSFEVVKYLYGQECNEINNEDSGVRIKWISDWSNFNVLLDGELYKENWSAKEVDICNLRNGQQYDIDVISTKSSSLEDSNPLKGVVSPGRLPTYGAISPIMTFTKINDDKFWVDLGFSSVNLYGQNIIDHEVKIFKSGSEIPGSPFTNNEGQSRWEVNYECGINYDAQVRVKVAWGTGWSDWSPKHGNYKIDCPKLDTPTSFNVDDFLGKDECGVSLGYSGVRIGWQSNSSGNSFKIDVSPKPNSGVWPRIVNGKTVDVCDLINQRPYDFSITAVDSLYEDSEALIKTIYPGQKPIWESNPISFSEHESGNRIKMTIGQPYSNLMGITKKELRIYENGDVKEIIEIGGNQPDWEFDYTCGVNYDADVRAHVGWGPNYSPPGTDENTVWSDWSPKHGNYKIDCPSSNKVPILIDDLNIDSNIETNKPISITMNTDYTHSAHAYETELEAIIYWDGPAGTVKAKSTNPSCSESGSPKCNWTNWEVSDDSSFSEKISNSPSLSNLWYARGTFIFNKLEIINNRFNLKNTYTASKLLQKHDGDGATESYPYSISNLQMTSLPIPTTTPILKSNINVSSSTAKVGDTITFTFDTNCLRDPNGPSFSCTPWNTLTSEWAPDSYNGLNFTQLPSINLKLKNEQGEIISITYWEKNKSPENPPPVCVVETKCTFTINYTIPDDPKWNGGGKFKLHQIEFDNDGIGSKFTGYDSDYVRNFYKLGMESGRYADPSTTKDSNGRDIGIEMDLWDLKVQNNNYFTVSAPIVKIDNMNNGVCPNGTPYDSSISDAMASSYLGNGSFGGPNGSNRLVCPEADQIYLDKYHWSSNYSEGSGVLFFKEATLEARFKFQDETLGYFGWGNNTSGNGSSNFSSSSLGIEFTTEGANIPVLTAGDTNVSFQSDPGARDFHNYKIIRSSSLIEAYVDGSRVAVIEIVEGTPNRSSCDSSYGSIPCAQTRSSELDKGKFAIGSDSITYIDWVKYTFNTAWP